MKQPDQKKTGNPRHQRVKNTAEDTDADTEKDNGNAAYTICQFSAQRSGQSSRKRKKRDDPAKVLFATHCPEVCRQFRNDQVKAAQKEEQAQAKQPELGGIGLLIFGLHFAVTKEQLIPGVITQPLEVPIVEYENLMTDGHGSAKYVLHSVEIKDGMQRALLTILVFLSFGPLVFGQFGLPENFHHRTLPNGLEVLVVENPAVPLATIELAVRHGAIHEAADENGLSHLYEHLFFKTNAQYPSADSIIGRINELGIVFNATTGDERVNYFISLSNAFLNEGIDFMAAAARSPRFSAEEIEREFDILESKLQRAESNPVHFMIQDINKALWGEHASRKNALGARDVIYNATTAQLEAMHRRYFVPDNCILLVSGDVDHEKVMQRCAQAFGDWEKPADGADNTIQVPEFNPLEASVGVITLDDRTQTPLVLAAFQGPVTSKDRTATFAADVLTYMLSQATSRLNAALIKSELAYQVAVGYNTQKYASPITVFLVPQPQYIQAAMDTLSAEINKWQDPDYFTEEELDQAKKMLVIQELYSRSTPSEVVHNLSYWWASADLKYFSEYTDRIEALTREDIARVAADYIVGAPNVTGILLTKDMQRMLEMDSFTPLNTTEQ